MINPDKFVDLLNDSYTIIDATPIAIFATSMGDLIIYEKGYLVFLNFRKNTSKIIGKKIKYLLEDLNSQTFLEKKLDWNPYLEAKEKLGEPAYDECFGYQPILAAGGPEKVENLIKVKLIEYIDVIVQFCGPLR